MWLHLINARRRAALATVALAPLFHIALCHPALAAATSRHLQPGGAPNAVDLYRLSLLADDHYAYTGRKFITIWREDGVVLASAMLFRHLPPALDSTTYTAPISARGRVILEHRGTRQLWTYIPQRNVIVHSVQPKSPLTQSTQPATLAALLKNYMLSIDPKPVSVAGRKAYALTVKSKQAGRPYNQLWIDLYTGIVLRREMYHADKSLSSVTYFSDLKLKPALSNAQFSPLQWSSRRPRLVEAHAPGVLAETGTDLGHLPPGYAGKAYLPKALDGYFLQSATLLHGKAQTALHLLYTDGLNQVSVYESLGRNIADQRQQRNETVRLNAVQSARVQRAYSYTVLTWFDNGMEYSVVADVSVKSLIHFAAALLQTRTG